MRYQPEHKNHEVNSAIGKNERFKALLLYLASHNM